MGGINATGEAVAALHSILDEATQDLIHGGPLPLGSLMKGHLVEGRSQGVVDFTPEVSEVRIGALAKTSQVHLDIQLFILNSSRRLNAEDVNIELCNRQVSIMFL